jgi:hypothetical protein
LNELAEHDPERGISIWLVVAQAVQIEGSRWAPLFVAVVEPNAFTATVEKVKQAETPLPTLDEFWGLFDSDEILKAAQHVVTAWETAGYRRRLGPNHVVLEAPGPSKNGIRTVIALYGDGRVLVPFGSYAGQNSGIPIEPLTTAAFRASADALFGFLGSERQARTAPGWLNAGTADALIDFSVKVASAYAAAFAEVPATQD